MTGDNPRGQLRVVAHGVPLASTLVRPLGAETLSTYVFPEQSPDMLPGGAPSARGLA